MSNPTPLAPERRAYSDDDREFACRWLDANEGNVSRTARELGIPVPTLHQWARGTRQPRARSASRDRPLRHLWHFRSRVLPVFGFGPPIFLDVTRLTPKQHNQLSRLLELARACPESDTADAPPGRHAAPIDPQLAEQIVEALARLRPHA